MSYQNVCKNCGSIDLFTKEKGNQVGLYCADCGKWIKWLGKDELNAFNNATKMKENFTDHLLNLGATRGYKEGYKQGREDTIMDVARLAEILIFSNDANEDALVIDSIHYVLEKLKESEGKNDL